MKKLKKYLILIGFAAVLGFAFSFLKHNGYWYKLSLGLKEIKWYFYPLIILLYFFIAILVHELGHLVSFVINKVKIRALYVLVFVLMRKDNNKWTLKIYPKHIKLLGGLVVPNLENIKSEEQLNNTRSAFSKALIAGPRTSIRYLIVLIITFFLIWFLTELNLLSALLYINVLVTLIMTILIVLSSKVNTNELYGDYVAYEKFLNNDKFALLQIIQYSSFSINESDEGTKFLYQYLTNFYQENELTYHFFDLVLASNLLNFYLESDHENNLSVEKIKKYYSINRLSNSKYGLELAYLISASYYKDKDVVKSYELFNLIQLNRNRNIDDEKQEFLFKQYEHMINLNNNETYFYNNKDKIVEELFVLAPIVNIDEMIKEMNKTLKFVNYYTKLYCKIDENNK